MFFNCFEHAPALFGAFTCFNHQHGLRSSQESFRNWRVLPTFDTQNFINCFCGSNLGIPTNSLHVIIFFKKIPDPSYPLPPENGEPMTGFLSWPGCWIHDWGMPRFRRYVHIILDTLILYIQKTNIVRNGWAYIILYPPYCGWLRNPAPPKKWLKT